MEALCFKNQPKIQKRETEAVRTTCAYLAYAKFSYKLKSYYIVLNNTGNKYNLISNISLNLKYIHIICLCVQKTIYLLYDSPKTFPKNFY